MSQSPVPGLEATAALTPDGVYCVDCVPDKWRRDYSQVFTIYPDSEHDSLPVCQACGRKHDYAALTLVGERFELEIAGPQPGDALLTECGPGNSLLEFSVCEGAFVGIYTPDQRAQLRRDVRDHLKGTHAVAWRVFAEGGSELMTTTPGSQADSSIYVNRVWHTRPKDGRSDEALSVLADD